jgi:hypothetical protein
MTGVKVIKFNNFMAFGYVSLSILQSGSRRAKSMPIHEGPGECMHLYVVTIWHKLKVSCGNPQVIGSVERYFLAVL